MIQGASCDSLYSQGFYSVEGVLWAPRRVLKFTDFTNLHLHCSLTQNFPEYFSFTALSCSRENYSFPKQHCEAGEIRANPYLSNSKNANLVS